MAHRSTISHTKLNYSYQFAGNMILQQQAGMASLKKLIYYYLNHPLLVRIQNEYHFEHIRSHEKILLSLRSWRGDIQL